MLYSIGMQDNRVMYDWLIRRGITDSVISMFNIHWGTHPIMGDCIVIPVVNEQGLCTFNKYRRDPRVDVKPKYTYDNGGKITLYGYWQAKDADTILITEGEMDALVAWSAHIPAVTSTGGAMSFQKEWAELLKDKDIVLCFDNDEAGGAGLVKALSVVPHAKVLFLPDRPGIKDISDYVAGGGNLSELLHSAKTFTSIEDVVDDRATRLALWQSTFFHDAYIKHHTVPVYSRSVTKNNTATEQAKSYPIPALLKFKARSTLCIFHSEKSPSLHYYPKTNTCYCFGGCGRAYDVIDVYRKLHACSFKEAVSNLAKKI